MKEFDSTRMADLMQTLESLGKAQQVSFVLNFLEAIGELEREVRSTLLLLARGSRVLDRPRLSIKELELEWEFDIQADQERDGIETVRMVTELDARSMQQAPVSESFLFHKSIRRVELECSCQANRRELCKHRVASLIYLRQQLSRCSAPEALGWIRECVSDGTEIGRQVVELLSGLRAPPTENSPSRLQWRISPSRRSYLGYPVSIQGYLQKQKKGGGWTKGRAVRSYSEAMDDQLISEPQDRTIAVLLESNGNSYSADVAWSQWELLNLLVGHPNVVLDEDPEWRVDVQIGKLTFQLQTDGQVYRPAVMVEGIRVDGLDELFTVRALYGEQCGGVLYDARNRRLWLVPLTERQWALMRETARALRRKVAFDTETAEQLADCLVDLVDRQEQVDIQLPSELAGPEQPLLPVIEVHMQPTDRALLQISLRVACSATLHPPVPGLPPETLRLVTPAGRFQLIRSLADESAVADRLATDLELGRLNFDGPYTWLAEDQDTVLDLLERIEQLGPNRPEVCWPRSNPLKLVGEVMPQKIQVQLKSQRDWFGIEGQVELSGLQIPFAELLAALRGGRRFVPLGDGQFAKLSEELRQRLTVLADLSTGDGGELRFSKAATPLVRQSLGADITIEVDQRWQQMLDRLDQVNQLNPKLPAGLNAELREYQQHGFAWLTRLSHLGLGGCLADDMGLGKTVQALGVLLDRAPQGAALVVAPTSVGINWQRETERFAPELKAHLYREHDRQHLVESAGPGDLVITSYQLLQRDAERFGSRHWHTLVLDEAQYIKNFQTKTAQAVRQLDIDWPLALTGTPLENHLGELWGLMRVISPGLLGSWERFRKMFAEPIERGKDRDRLGTLSRIVQPFVLRRTKREVLQELPPRTEIVRTTELSEAERQKYDAARLAALSELAAVGPDGNPQQQRIRVLAWLTKLRQLACHPRLVDARWSKSSAKLDLFIEIVQELREGDHRALVFSQFVQHLSLIRAALDARGISYQYLDGQTPTAKRQEAIDRFQAGEGDLFLISLKAGGTGLNLTEADYVLHLDPWWNPAVEDQATDRAHRIGQRRSVTVYRLVAKDTIEEQILAMHEQKRELIAGVLDGSDRAARMSTDDLIQLIRISSVNSR
jgi:superfamily II DNA or RNA helicase